MRAKCIISTSSTDPLLSKEETLGIYGSNETRLPVYTSMINQ